MKKADALSGATAPRVSVIVPVYNAEPYLHEFLDSVVHQTLNDIEIICVDDCSVDGSLHILRQYEARDQRITIIEQKQKRQPGDDSPRDMGLAAASGEYVVFWDDDDFFELTALETLYAQCKKYDADLCVCGGWSYDDQRKEDAPYNALLKSEYLPIDVPFSRNDRPIHILTFTTGCVWNKMWRRQFIGEQNIHFLKEEGIGDFLFVFLSIAAADRIVAVNQRLVHYRVNQPERALKSYAINAGIHRLLLALKRELLARELWDSLVQGFSNLALRSCVEVLTINFRWNRLAGKANRGRLRDFYNELRDGGFEQLGVAGHGAEYFHRQDDYEEYLKIMRLPWSLYLGDFIQRSVRNKLRAYWRKLWKRG